MFKFPAFRRKDDRPATRRSHAGRKPKVESLEGRQLLSTVAVAVTPVPAHIQGAHIG